MARIDFYVLSQSGEQARQVYACRLAEKAYKLEHTVHIHTGDEAAAALAASARRLVERRFSFDRVARDLGALYSRIVLGDPQAL